MKLKKSQIPIWGKGDLLTLKILKKLKPRGLWLDLAAGDGRYVPELLLTVDRLVALDIDSPSLKKLKKTVKKKDARKLQTTLADITKPLPFPKESFDGVLCTGTLHCFPLMDVKKIFSHVDHVLKPGGKIIIDFATDIERDYRKTDKHPSQPVTVLYKGPGYNIQEAGNFWKGLLPNYRARIWKSTFKDDVTDIPEYGFRAKGKYLLIIATKKW